MENILLGFPDPLAIQSLDVGFYYWSLVQSLTRVIFEKTKLLEYLLLVYSGLIMILAPTYVGTNIIFLSGRTWETNNKVCLDFYKARQGNFLFPIPSLVTFSMELRAYSFVSNLAAIGHVTCSIVHFGVGSFPRLQSRI